LALVANDWNEQDCATPTSWDCGVILLTRNCSVCGGNNQQDPISGTIQQNDENKND
jgi:hypothetical protein